MDINKLLNQFFTEPSNEQSASPHENQQQQESSWSDTAKNIAQNATQGGLGGFAGGAVAGGLLSLLLTNSKAKKIAGGVIGYGGAAALGAMALKAYQNYQANQNTQTENKNHAAQPLANTYNTNAAAFNLILIKSMVMASKVDGHIDSNEQQRIFSALEKSTLSADEKALVLDALSQPVNIQEITTNITNPEQAAQVYLASRIAIDPDQPVEKEYLSNLAGALKLPSELVMQLEKQIEQQPR